MKSKLKFIVPLVVLLALGVTYKVFLVQPPAKEHKKIEGVVYVLPKEFVLNLDDNRYAKLNVALVLDHSQPTAPVAEGEGEVVEPPEGFGTLEQEAVIRDIVVDELTGAKAKELNNAKLRVKLKRKVLKQIKAHTDVKVEDVLFTDIAIQ